MGIQFLPDYIMKCKMLYITLKQQVCSDITGVLSSLIKKKKSPCWLISMVVERNGA